MWSSTMRTTFLVLSGPGKKRLIGPDLKATRRLWRGYGISTTKRILNIGDPPDGEKSVGVEVSYNQTQCAQATAA
jgi:hypothetical protein